MKALSGFLMILRQMTLKVHNVVVQQMRCSLSEPRKTCVANALSLVLSLQNIQSDYTYIVA